MPVPDAKLNALVTLVKVVRERGYAKQGTIQNFLAAGYQKEQVMELLVSMAQKTISDYVDYISPTPPSPPHSRRQVTYRLKRSKP